MSESCKGCEKLKLGLAIALDALTSIANSTKPEQATFSYWKGMSHRECADVLATDTKIARDALAVLSESEA